MMMVTFIRRNAYTFLLFLPFLLMATATDSVEAQQSIRFGIQETYTLTSSDSAFKAGLEHIKRHKESTSFLDASLPINRAVKDQGFTHYFALVFQADLDEMMETIKQSQSQAEYREINVNGRTFRTFLISRKQLLIFYREPEHDTRISINTLVNSEAKDDTEALQSHFDNIENWLKRIES